MSVLGIVLRAVVERQARNSTLAELIAKLEASRSVVTERFDGAADTPRNREQMAHIIGIERWGERRLRVALGESPLADEYNGYRPDTSERLETLRAAWQQTQRQTVATARALEQADGGSRTALHNEMGEVSMRGWFAYLDGHATRESRWMKRR